MAKIDVQPDMVTANGHVASVWHGTLFSRPHNVGIRPSVGRGRRAPAGPRYCSGFENLNPDPVPADPRAQTREWTRYSCGTLNVGRRSTATGALSIFAPNLRTYS